MVKNLCQLKSPQSGKDCLLIIIFFSISHLLKRDSAFEVKCSSSDSAMCNWKEAVDLCKSLNSTLATFTSDMEKPLTHANFYGRNEFWTGRYKIRSPWIEITGCYSVDPDLLKKAEEMNVSLCFAYCKNYTHFGLQENSCICLDEIPQPSTQVSNNSCVPSKINANYIVGQQGFIAVFRKGTTARIDDKQDTSHSLACASVSCEPPTWKYYVTPCDGSNFVLCEDGQVRSLSAVMWKDASSKCNNRGSYLAGPNSITKHCKNTTGSLWTYFHRELVKIDINFLDKYEDSDLIYCEYISIPSDRMLINISEDLCENRKGVACIKEDLRTTISTKSDSSASDVNRASTTYGSTTERRKSCTILTTFTIDIDTTTSDSEIPVHSSRGSIISSTLSQGESSETQGSTTYIAIGCGGGVVIIIVCIIIVVCRMRSKKEKKSENTKLAVVNNNIYGKDTEKQKIDYNIPSNFNEKPAYEMIDIDETEVQHIDIDSKLENKNSYQPLSKQTGDSNSTKYGMVAPNSNNPEKQVKNNTIFTRNDTKQSTTENGRIHNKRDDYDHIDNNIVKDKNSQYKEDKTYDKGLVNRETDYGDYDKFERNKAQRFNPAFNYDHVRVRQNNSKNGSGAEGDDDLEDYDHLQSSPTKRQSVNSTYDHTNAFNYEGVYNQFQGEDSGSTSDTYDHLPNEEDDNDEDYATARNLDDDNRISGDYEISDEVPAVKIKSGNRDSYYTSVTLSEMNDC